MSEQADDQVSRQDDGLRNSPKGEAPDTPRLAGAYAAHADCYWNDKRYSDGGTVCDSGQRFKCWDGKWVDIGNC